MMTQENELRTAVALMAHTLHALAATLAHLAEHIPDEELRTGALKDLDAVTKVTKGLAAVFPPETLPIEHRGLLH